MSYLEYTVKTVPTGLRKILYFNWALALLLTTIAALGILQLYSVAGGAFLPWASPQINRFILGFCLMVAVGLTPIWFWRSVSGLAYLSAVGLLLFVEFFGSDRMGAKRWIDLGFMNLQPSEVMKISLVMMLAAYYDWLPLEKTSKILWVILPLMIILLPTVLVIRQPDLGTAIAHGRRHVFDVSGWPTLGVFCHDDCRSSCPCFNYFTKPWHPMANAERLSVQAD